MDGITLDALIAEARPLVVGRHLGRVTLGGPEAIHLELAGRSRLCVRLDAGRATPGLYLLSRDDARALSSLPDARGGGARHALLLFRKHLEGKRVTSLERVAGSRVVRLEVVGGGLVLRLSAPALTLTDGETALASLGSGPPAFPAPRPVPERDWDRVDATALEEALREGQRAVLDLCPSLGPILARRLVEGTDSVVSLRRSLATPRPTVVMSAAPAELTDARLADPGSVVLLPFLPDPPASVDSPESPREAARLFLKARRQGMVFAERRRRVLDQARREVRRLRALETHLRADLLGLPEEGALRRSAEALLTAPSPSVRRGSASVTVPDPRDPGQTLTIAVDPARSLPANADRLFEKARRIGRAREQIAARLLALEPSLESALSRQEQALSASNASDLPEGDALDRPPRPTDPATSRDPRTQPSQPRHYLSSGGLSIRVGRGARENQALTFGLARPEDFWLHARDVPGAHVILQDVGGRAGPQDLREAAELAAFFSEARGESGVDVHVTRRKHVRPAGGSGRVRVGHSETLRVAPRDPLGRLRQR